MIFHALGLFCWFCAVHCDGRQWAGVKGVGRTLTFLCSSLQGSGQIQNGRCSIPSDRDGVVHDEDLDPEQEWITYEFRKAHPLLQWLPTKLAKWIGANLSNALLIPDKMEDKCTAAALNDIILHNIVRGPHGHLRTFGGIKWECDLLNGRPKALC